MDFIVSIISSASVSGLVAIALVRFSRDWLSERLKRSIEHEYAQKLVAHKSILKAENDVALERLRASISQNQSIQSVATSTFTAINIASHDRKIKAVEEFWISIVAIKNGVPDVFTVLDIIPPDEYPNLLKNKYTKTSIEKLSLENIKSSICDNSDNVEIIRPFIGEYLYNLFFGYRALMGRISYIVMEGRDKGNISKWFENQGVRELIASVSNKEEFKQFDNMQINKISYIRTLIEGKILSHISKILSGESNSELSLKQASKIAAAINQIEKVPFNSK